MAFRVFLDPGHGGNDPGAVYNERKEKDDVLKLALAVGRILEDDGVDVVYSRTDDSYDSPYEKAMKGNESEADLFVSLHRNSTDPPNSATGVDMLVYSDTGFSSDVANKIGDEIAKTSFSYNGITERPNLAVLRRTKMPAVLIEAGFINNKKDNEFFDENFDEIAKAIADGILNAAFPEDLEINNKDNISNQAKPISKSFTPSDLNINTPYTENISTKNTSFDNMKSENISIENTSSDNMKPENISIENTSSDNMKPENISIENTSSDNMKPENISIENTSSDNMKSESISTKNTSSDNMKSENISMENTSFNNIKPMDNITPSVIHQKPDNNIQYTPPISDNKDKLYRVQVGAFTNPMFATQLLNQLLLEGFPAFIVFSDGLYRVQVGAFNKLDNAVKMEKRLRSQGYQTYITT